MLYSLAADVELSPLPVRRHKPCPRAPTQPAPTAEAIGCCAAQQPFAAPERLSPIPLLPAPAVSSPSCTSLFSRDAHDPSRRAPPTVWDQRGCEPICTPRGPGGPTAGDAPPLRRDEESDLGVLLGARSAPAMPKTPWRQSQPRQRWTAIPPPAPAHPSPRALLTHSRAASSLLAPTFDRRHQPPPESTEAFLRKHARWQDSLRSALSNADGCAARPHARMCVCMPARAAPRRRRARRAARRFAASLLANTAGTRGRWWARPLPTALARPLACSRASRRAKWRRSTRPRESWRGPRVHTARLAQNVPPPFLPLLWLAPSPRRRHPCCPSFLRHRCRGCSMSRARTPTWTTRTSPPSTARCLPPSEGS